MTLKDLEAKLNRRPHSPVFARIADEYLKLGRVKEAKDICTAGLVYHPNYLTAQLILTKCLEAESDFTNACKTLNKLVTILPDFDSLKSYLQELEKKRVLSPTKETQSEDEIQTTTSLNKTDTLEPESLENKQIEIETKVESTQSEIQPPIDAPQILTNENIKQPLTEKTDNESVYTSRITDDGRIVSRTLAEIYAHQGAYSEAIITYQLLKQLYPNRSDEYDARIQQLEEKMKKSQ